MKRPLFSCVVPVKGPRPFMDVALESLRLQGLGEELEVIVQDADVEPDSGQSDALNRGFAKATGDWFFWLNADDVLLPSALKAVKELIDARGTSVDWISGNTAYLDPDGRVTRCTEERGCKGGYEGLPVRTFGPSSFFRRGLLEKCGSFDASLHYCMDTDLWCRFRAAGSWYEKLPRYVWGFRVHHDSKTSGALVGDVPEAMADEIRRIDQTYGTNHWRLRVMRLRLGRLLDGSTFRSLCATRRFRGRYWKEVVA